MERTKEYSVVNDTLKALKNQGLSERYFQKGHSFSSQARYDHFDTSPSHAFHYSTDLEEKGSTNLRKKAGASYKHRLEEG